MADDDAYVYLDGKQIWDWVQARTLRYGSQNAASRPRPEPGGAILNRHAVKLLGGQAAVDWLNNFRPPDDDSGVGVPA
jgi:hypothetical protein